jgi:hypothetical protein
MYMGTCCTVDANVPGIWGLGIPNISLRSSCHFGSAVVQEPNQVLHTLNKIQSRR